MMPATQTSAGSHDMPASGSEQETKTVTHDFSDRSQNRAPITLPFKSQSKKSIPAMPVLVSLPPEAVSAITHIQLPEDGNQTLLNFAKEAGALLKLNGLYLFENVPVTIHPVTGIMTKMSPLRLQTHIQEFALTYRFSAGDNLETELISSTLPMECAEGTLKSDAFLQQLLPVKRINPVRMPVIRQNGILELLPVGYDEETAIFTRQSGIEYKELEMTEARMVFYDLLQDFPFSDLQADGISCGKAITIAGMLSLFASSLLPPGAKRLNFIFNANSHSSGTTLLAQMVIIPIMGDCRMQNVAGNNNGSAHAVSGEGEEAHPYLLFDNLSGDEKLILLEELLTASSWNGCISGVQQQFKMTDTGTVYITGNNLQVSDEIKRRSLTVDLYVEEADVSKLCTIERVIDSTYLCRTDVRCTILSALWTMINEWHKASRPRGSYEVRGFEAWSNIYGSIVEYAGFGSPLEGAMDNNDTEYLEMLAVVSKLIEKAEIFYSNSKSTEVQLIKLAEVAYSLAAFEKYIEKNADEEVFSLTHDSELRLNILLSTKFGGRIFTLADNRRVRFGQKSKNQSKFFALEILG